MKLWIDDVRPAPEGYVWCRTVNTAKSRILQIEQFRQDKINAAECALEEFRYDDAEGWMQLLDSDKYKIELIDTDHDAGDYASCGGDYIKLLDWLEETGRNYPIHIHSMNPVGVANMRAIIKRNGWTEVR